MRLGNAIAAAGLMVLALGSGGSVAAEYPSNRLITDIGCHHVNAICYVTLDGGTLGSSLGCPVAPTSEFRFDDGDTAIGRRTYASLLAAFLAKKHVSFMVDGCTVQGYPKLTYFHVTE